MKEGEGDLHFFSYERRRFVQERTGEGKKKSETGIVARKGQKKGGKGVFSYLFMNTLKGRKKKEDGFTRRGS